MAAVLAVATAALAASSGSCRIASTPKNTKAAFTLKPGWQKLPVYPYYNCGQHKWTRRTTDDAVRKHIEASLSGGVGTSASATSYLLYQKYRGNVECAGMFYYDAKLDLYRPPDGWLHRLEASTPRMSYFYCPPPATQFPTAYPTLAGGLQFEWNGKGKAGNICADSLGWSITGKHGNLPKRNTDGFCRFDNKHYVPINHQMNKPIPEFTAEAWFRTSDQRGGNFDNWALLDFDRSEYFNIFVTAKGAIGFSTANKKGISDYYSVRQGLNDGQWHQVVVTYSAVQKTKKIYVDGVYDSKKAIVGPIGEGKHARYGFIGDGSEASKHNGKRNKNYYTGELASVSFFDVEKSPAEVAALRAAPEHSHLVPAPTQYPTAYPTHAGELQFKWNGDHQKNCVTYHGNADWTITGKHGNLPTPSKTTGFCKFDNKHYIPINHLMNAPIPEFTAESWFRTKAKAGNFDNWALLDFDRSEYFNIYITGKGQVGFSTSSKAQILDFYSKAAGLNDGKWHHVAVTYSAAKGVKKIYVDGAYDSSKKIKGPIGEGRRNRFGYIGDGSESLKHNGDRNKYYYEGELATVAFYTGVKSDDEVAAMAASVPGVVVPSVSGDPFAVNQNGQKVQFFLPLQQETHLLTCQGMQLYGRTMGTGIEGDSQQWFDMLRIVVNGDERLLVSIQNNVTTQAVVEEDDDVSQARQELSILRVVAGGEKVKRTGAVIGSSASLVAVWRDGKGETVQFSEDKTVLQVKSAVAQKFSGAEQKAYTHLDLRFVELKSESCTAGILAEIWGVVPMSQATAAMLAH